MRCAVLRRRPSPRLSPPDGRSTNKPAIAALRLLAVLNVLFKYASARPAARALFRRAFQTSRPPPRGEKSGLAGSSSATRDPVWLTHGRRRDATGNFTFGVIGQATYGNEWRTRVAAARASYSYRSATRGSTLVARRAGM